MGTAPRSPIKHFTYLDTWRSFKHIHQFAEITLLFPPGDITLLLREAIPFLNKCEMRGIFRVLRGPAEPLARSSPRNRYCGQQMRLERDCVARGHVERNDDGPCVFRCSDRRRLFLR